MLSDIEMDQFIKKAAQAVSSNFPPYITADDTANAIWVWYLENEATVRNLITDNESWEPMLFTTMTRVGNEAALNEDAAANGYSRDDVYFYTTPVVRELLKDVFDYEDWQSFSTFGDGQPKAKGQVNMTGDRIAMLADVKSAVERLGDDQYNIILWAYKYGFPASEIAKALQVSEDAARKRLSRAVQAVRRKLGRTPLTDLQNGHDGRMKAYATDGEKRRMSNAQALAYQENSYDG